MILPRSFWTKSCFFFGIVLACFTSTSAGASLSNTNACEKYKSSCERSTPNELQHQAWTCEAELAGNDCRSFFSNIEKKISSLPKEIEQAPSQTKKELLQEELQDQWELQKKFRNCSTYQLCQENQTSTENHLQECLKQMFDPFLDGIKFVFSQGPALLKEANLRRAALQRNPDIYTKSIEELKQGLLKPFYLLMEQERKQPFKEYSPLMKNFLEKLKSWEKFTKEHPEKRYTCFEYQQGPLSGGSNQISKSFPCNYFQSQLQSSSRDLAELSILARQSLIEPQDDIFGMIQKMIQHQKQKYQCLNAQGRRDMICYAVFSIVDPLMLTGASIKGIRWAKSSAKLADGAAVAEKAETLISSENKATSEVKALPEKSSEVLSSEKSLPSEKKTSASTELGATNPSEGKNLARTNYRPTRLEHTNTSKKPQKPERRHILENGDHDKAKGLTKERLEYSEKYKTDATVKEERLAYSKLLENPKNKASTFVFENSILKYLNDYFKDKAFPTALNNRYNNLLKEKVEKFIADYNSKNPTKKLEPFYYSDWKAFHVAFKNGNHKELVEKMGEIYQQSTLEFLSEVRSKKILRDDDLQKIQGAYLAGSGETTDEAARAARLARDVSHTRSTDADEFAEIPKMVDFRSKEFNTQDKIKTNLLFADSLRSELQSTLGKKRLLKQANDIGFLANGTNGAKIPTGTVLEVMRKNEGKLPVVGSPDFAIKEQEVLDRVLKTLEYRFPEMTKWKMTENEKRNFVRKLMDYSKLVDENAPPLIKVDRNLASLDAAELGGHTADVAALGAANLEQLAKDLQASMSKVDFSQSHPNFHPMFQRIRKGESLVTQKLNTITRSMKKAAKDVFQGKAKIICSGDDCVLIFKEEVPMEKKLEYLRTVHQNLEKPSSLRISFVPPSIVKEEIRTTMATQGESLEKIIRERMEEVLSYKDLQKLGISIDMNTTVKQQGQVNVIFGNSKVDFKPGERQKLQSIVQESIQHWNEQISKADGSISNYQSGEILFSERRGPPRQK